MTSEDDAGQGHQSDQEEDDPDGSFAFKRTAGCSYHAPLIDHFGNWDWESPQVGGSGQPQHRFSFMTLNNNPNSSNNSRSNFSGFVRRRIGRGGRYVSLLLCLCFSISPDVVCHSILGSFSIVSVLLSLHKTRFPKLTMALKNQ